MLTIQPIACDCATDPIAPRAFGGRGGEEERPELNTLGELNRFLDYVCAHPARAGEYAMDDHHLSSLVGGREPERSPAYQFDAPHPA